MYNIRSIKFSIEMSKMKCISLLFFLLSLNLFAQQKPGDDRIKIGLVLSGGGAKGLAHIGALKIIEESGIHIDYIGGSSMGAIIGGLYAAGYSAEQLDSIFRSTNFEALIQDDLPRGAKTFYEKERSQRYALTLPFNDFKLSFPSGISQGQNIYDLLEQLIYPVRNIHDFSKLPTPFFCIGTNIETGQRVVLDRGSLAQDIAASGAIPSLFSPVEINGQLISDGGLTDNFPVEEMQKRGVDYIIGIDVQDSLVGRNKLKTVFDIISQVNNFRTIKAMKGKLKLTDLYIKPNITDFSILSFDKGKKIVEAGEKAALKVKSVLDSLAQLQQQPYHRPHIEVQDSVRINQIWISGNEKNPRDFIRGKLEIPTHQKISYKSLNKGIEHLFATGNFNRITYKLAPQKNGSNNLRLYLNENDNQTSLRFSVHYDELYKSAALVNLTHKRLLFDNDITSLDVIVGDNFRYKFNYFIDKGNYWSIGLSSKLNQYNQDVKFDFVAAKFPNNVFNINKIRLHYFNLTNQFYAETFFLNTLRLGIGFQHKYTAMKTGTFLVNVANVNRPVTVIEKSNIYGPYAYLEYDSYDNPYFPTKGIHFRGDVQVFLFGSGSSFKFDKYSVVRGSLGYAFTPFPKFSVRAQLGMGFHIAHTDMTALNFFLGGYGNYYLNNIVPFFGYDFLDKTGNSFNKAALEVDYRIFPKNHLMAGYNIANIGHDLLEGGRMFDAPDYTGFFVGYGIETFLGPLEVHYSYSPETTRSEWFVNLGFWF